MAAELSLLFKLKAQNEAGATLKNLESQIASLKARIKEVKTESDIGFRTERIAAHQERLKLLTAQHKELKDATKLSAQSNEDLANALGSVSPRLGVLSGALTGAINPLTAVAVGTAAIGAAAIGIITGLFSAAQSASEYGSKIFDAAQKTNFQVETLSALDVIQRRNGSTLDALIPSLGIFQVNMVKASEGGNALSKTFKELNIDTENQEVAFRQAIKTLAEMGQTERQTTAAKKLFGRAGLEVLAIVKETNGNLDEAIKKYEELGLIISSEAAAAADAFGDSLEQLTDQLSAMARSIGFAVIPVLNVFVEDVSRALAGNQNAWKDWRNVIEVEVALVIGTLEGLIQFIASRFTVDLGDAIDRSIRGLLERADQQRAVLGAIAVTDRASRIGARGDRGTGSGGGGRTKPRDTAQQDAIKEAGLAEREALLLNSADVAENKRALEEQVRSLKEFTQRAIDLADARHHAAIDRINAEQTALDIANSKKLISQKDYDVQNRELVIRNTKAQQDNADEVFKLKREQDLKIAARENATRRRDEQIATEADERIIARIRDRVRQEIITEADGIRQIAAIVDDGFRRRRQALQEEEDAYSSSLERIEEINAERIRLDGERAGAAEEASRRIVEAIEKEKKAEFDRQNEGAQGATRPRRVFEEEESPFGFDLEGFATTIEESIVPLNEILANSFLQVADAIGQTVANWVLLGETGPAVMRKILAQALASIAAEAAVNAVKELALGFAMLFLNPAESAAHFTAAGLWASIAGVAAIAGRGVAGDLFKPQSHGRESSSGSNSPQELNPLTLSRNPRSNDQPLVVHLDIKQDRHSIVDVWMDDYTTGGRSREAVVNDGGIIP